jgi:perosamine synthetase
MGLQETADLIERAVRETYGEPQAPVPLHAPHFAGKEWEFVKECLDSGWVSSVGKYVDRFEGMMRDFTGAGYAVATVNGTAAIHVALALAGVEPGEVVLCPAFSFVGTVSPVVHSGAFPVFMDSDRETLGLDVNKLRRFLSDCCTRKEDGFTYHGKTHRRIKACIAMHPYGYPVDMDPLLRLCSEANIRILEDAAEALGSYYGGKHCGTLGEVGILSFNGNKIITTGGGGMVLTNDGEKASRAKHLTTTAKVDHPWEYVHDEVGFNYRMPNLNAALGCAQMEKLGSFLAQKTQQSSILKEILRGCEGVEVIDPSIGVGNHWLNLVAVDRGLRDGVLKSLNDRGVQARASWFPICDMKPYVHFESFLIETARELSASIICLPNGVLK